MKMDWGSVYLSSIPRYDPCKLSNPRMTIEQANQKQTYIYISNNLFCVLLPHGISTTDPDVFRLSRSVCACAACDKGYV